MKIPEGIFTTPLGNRVSVEVKQIISLQYKDGKRAMHGDFAWKSTILSAIDKAHNTIVLTHSVTAHHIVLCTPLNDRIRRRVEKHANRLLHAHLNSGAATCNVRRVYIHVIAVPSFVMVG